MSDLAGKFTGIEAQLSTQHAEIISALDSIAFALGAPPPAPTITLATISMQLNALNNNLIGIAIANGSFYAELLSLIGQINTNTDLMLTNNALNTQRLLIAIAANDPCKSCDIVPIEPPPIDITPQLVDQEHCKRMQALIYALRRFTVKLDVLSSFGLGFSPTVIRDAITEIITELGVMELLEYPSLGEVAQIAGAAAAYVVSNIFASNSLPAAFLSIEDALLPALYAADTASAGQAAYRSVVAGSSLSTPIVNLFQAMAYTSIFNLYYDSTIELDLSGYDGTICSPEPECFEFESSAITTSLPGDGSFQDVPRNSVVWGEGWSADDIDKNGYTYSELAVLLGNYQGWRIRATIGSFRLVQYTSTDTFVYVVTSSQHTISETTIGIYLDDYEIGASFSIEFCEPE